MGMNEQQLLQMQSNPMQQPSSPVSESQPDTTLVLEDMVLQYVDYAVGVKNDLTLNHQVKSKIMLDMAQAVGYLVPLMKDDAQNDLMMKQAELEMKGQEMQMDMEMKKAELELKREEHSMKLQHSQQEQQMKMKHQEENHQHSLVQNQQSHESKMEQQKQAAQSKQSSNQSNDKGKK